MRSNVLLDILGLSLLVAAAFIAFGTGAAVGSAGVAVILLNAVYRTGSHRSATETRELGERT